ncbi:hypothetical protein P5673_002894 [Acropora cervicornis]|uniref:Uncharacterized protein n=1 Tax=Acropora cervicornis TaxID=6130 RepID=A0AAD9R408_ACRCE|nr:hypothetical protein P5673_002894 [Acropora cervicornis]
MRYCRTKRCKLWMTRERANRIAEVTKFHIEHGQAKKAETNGNEKLFLTWQTVTQQRTVCLEIIHKLTRFLDSSPSQAWILSGIFVAA